MSDDDSSASRARRNPEKPMKSFGARVRGWLLVPVLLAAMGGAGVAGYVATQSVVQQKSPQTVWNAMPSLPEIFIENPQSHFGADRINVLVMGIDYDYDDKDIESSAKARSDTIMALSLGFPTTANPHGTVSELSIPRDMDVMLPNGQGENKINAAYSFGGAKEAERVVADFLGIPQFDRYITLRIDATKSLIDAIGGIDITPEKTMNYDDNWGHLHIHFIGGKHYHMNGEQAVSYSRFRHDACSDPCRIKRQQQVLRTTIAKLKNDRLNDLMHVNRLIEVVRKNVYTDIGDREALSLAYAFSHVDLAGIKTTQVPYTDDKSLACCGDVLIADQAAKAQLVRKLFLDPNPLAVAAVASSSIKVQVQNGAGTPGLGAQVAGELRKRGFTVAGVTDAPNFGYSTTEIHVHASATPLAGEKVRVAIGLPLATVATDGDSAEPTDVTVIVGQDFRAAGDAAPRMP